MTILFTKLDSIIYFLRFASMKHSFEFFLDDLGNFLTSEKFSLIQEQVLGGFAIL